MKVVDMHCDTIAEIYKDHKKGGRQSILENQMMLDLKKMQAGDYGLQNFALYVNLEQAKGRPFEFWNFWIPSTRKWKPMRIS